MNRQAENNVRFRTAPPFIQDARHSRVGELMKDVMNQFVYGVPESSPSENERGEWTVEHQNSHGDYSGKLQMCIFYPIPYMLL